MKDDGYATLDALMAATILSLAAVSMSAAWRSAITAADRAQALRAESATANTIVETRWRDALEPGELRGVSDDGRYKWRIEAREQRPNNSAATVRVFAVKANVTPVNGGPSRTITTYKLLGADEPFEGAPFDALR